MMSNKKYLVRVYRLAYKSVMFSVEAESEEDARREAFEVVNEREDELPWEADGIERYIIEVVLFDEEWNEKLVGLRK